MRKHIINLTEVELQPRPPQFAPTGRAAERYEARVGMIAPKIGAKQLGYNLTALPPGKRAYPFHSHRVQEEMFFVIEGAGEVRLGAETFPIRAGDIIACPTGGPETAHHQDAGRGLRISGHRQDRRLYREHAVRVSRRPAGRLLGRRVT